MSGQFKPNPVFQLRKDPRHPEGSKHAGTNCNAAVGATLVALVTCGARHPSAAAVRELTVDETGGMDKKGGTHNSQIARALSKGFGVDLDLHNGSFKAVVAALREGRGVSLSGSSVATMGIKEFDAQHGFDGNHQWALIDIEDHGDDPIVTVHDPLADGRRGLARSPLRMPLSRVRRFAGMLDFRTEQEIRDHKPRKPLGMGRAIYATTDVVRCGAAKHAAGPAHVVLHANASLVNGQEGRPRKVKVPVARVRSAPTTDSRIVARKPQGSVFQAFQQVNGKPVEGSPVWFGDHEGQRWMHISLFE